MEIRSNMKKYTGTKVIILKTKTNIRAWHFCDICDYKDKCEYRRKVVVCPYLKIEKKIVMTFVTVNKSDLKCLFNKNSY